LSHENEGDPPTVLRHRTALSVATNASGIADSTISFTAFAAEHFADFPAPPEAIPSPIPPSQAGTPIQNVFHLPTPTRSQFHVLPHTMAPGSTRNHSAATTPTRST